MAEHQPPDCLPDDSGPMEVLELVYEAIHDLKSALNSRLTYLREAHVVAKRDSHRIKALEDIATAARELLSAPCDPARNILRSALANLDALTTTPQPPGDGQNPEETRG